MILPNQLTVLRIILTPIFIIFFISEEPYFREISLAIFLIAALTDWYDGWLARKFNYITEWGKFWDPLADKILTSAAFLGFVYLGVLNPVFVSLIVFRDIGITLLRGIADKQRKSIITSRYAKIKTFIQMAFLYYLIIVYVLSHNSSIGGANPGLFSVLLDEKVVFYSMLAVTILTVHSGIVYITTNKRTISEIFTELRKQL